MDEATIGARLRILRRWRGMTQAEVAGLADLSKSFVSKIENGQRAASCAAWPRAWACCTGQPFTLRIQTSSRW